MIRRVSASTVPATGFAVVCSSHGVAHVVLVLCQDEEPRERVPNDRLRAEPQRDPGDSCGGKEGSEVHADRGEDDQDHHAPDDDLERAQQQVGDRGAPASLLELVALGPLGELCGALFEPANVSPGDQVHDEGDEEDHAQRDTDGQPPLRAESGRVRLLRENEEHAPIQLGVTGSVKEERGRVMSAPIPIQGSRGSSAVDLAPESKPGASLPPSSRSHRPHTGASSGWCSGVHLVACDPAQQPTDPLGGCPRSTHQNAIAENAPSMSGSFSACSPSVPIAHSGRRARSHGVRMQPAAERSGARRPSPAPTTRPRLDAAHLPVSRSEHSERGLPEQRRPPISTGNASCQSQIRVLGVFVVVVRRSKLAQVGGEVIEVPCEPVEVHGDPVDRVAGRSRCRCATRLLRHPRPSRDLAPEEPGPPCPSRRARGAHRSRSRWRHAARRV